ncbi:copper chaperone PCu(A)C [Sphingopyxis fribergensis]
MALLLSLPLMACQQSAPVEVDDVWTRDTIGGTASAAVYMTITSTKADRLVAVSTPAAKKADIMTMENGAGAMGMKYLDTLDIPGGKPVHLEPTGLHIWLAELNKPLRGGETFPMTLRFEKSGDRQIVVSVIGPAEAPPEPAMNM